jgi:hypothetical protein
MDRPVALVHAPEGAGNATRMLAVAEALEERGAAVSLAGGGPGADFLRMNGFEEFEPPTLDFIAKREGADPTLLAAIRHAAPRAGRRLRSLYGWLRRENPRVLLTDDPFAALPAMLLGIPWFRIDHSNVASYDDPFERLAFKLFNGLSLRASEGFFFTSVYENPYPTRKNLVPVGPIAHEPADPDPVDPFDVLVIPGTYSNGFDDVASRLRESGNSVTVVGDGDWEAVPSMFPYHRAANAVLCTGFSSIAEAVVAGTPCVVYPFIDCQQGVADRIATQDIEGIEVVHDVDAAVEALQDPPAEPAFENGAGDVAAHVMAFLDEDDQMDR